MTAAAKELDFTKLAALMQRFDNVDPETVDNRGAPIDYGTAVAAFVAARRMLHAHGMRFHDLFEGMGGDELSQTERELFDLSVQISTSAVRENAILRRQSELFRAKVMDAELASTNAQDELAKARGDNGVLVAEISALRAEFAKLCCKPSASVSSLQTSPSLMPSDIGKLIPGQGIYLGIWKPVDRNGNSLSQTFDIYAAPTDLERPLLTFNNAVKKVAALRNWHGHDGAHMPNDEAVYNAIRNGNHAELSKWFIPTREILDGKNVDGTKIQTDNLYDNKATGAFNTTFVMSSGSDLALWYWSCTEHRDTSSHVWDTSFSDGDEAWDRKDNHELSPRPVRAVPRAA